MAQKMLIDATHPEETRVVVVDGTKVEEFDFETASRRQLAGNIYLAKVTRVEPSLQAAFVDYGGNRHGFLAFNEVHPDYYQIPAADRAALLAEEQALASDSDDDNGRPKVRRSSNRRSGGGRSRAERTHSNDAVDTRDIAGMDIVEPRGTDDAGLVDATAPDADRAPPPADNADAETSPQGDTASHTENRSARPAKRDDGDVGDDDADTGEDTDNDDGPYVAADHASETDDQIESVADDDTSEELRQRRRPRLRKYKIQEVIKVRQIMLVQVVKEERGNKGAALTTYLSLAGRYCVLMPNTARGGGISRKITNAVDRKKLKEIAGTIEVPKGAGLIIRTAGAKRTKAEIKRDYEYLFRLWEQIRELTLKSIAPAPIYEEGDLIKRSIRDLYSRNIDEVLVEGMDGYRVAKDFMKMIMPSHARNVKQYQDQMPLFARYQVESYLTGMLNPMVQLPSGGYIVIGVTEALVAIDVNSGKATKEGSIEDTALRTNLEASEEIARQLRLRDLAGLIVIDFIDMEERRNNASVEKLLKDKLKSDRARIQVGRISGFGLLEMSRQRLRPGMLESTTQPCPHCHGTGLIRSDDSVALAILRQIEEEGTRRRSREVLVKAPVGIVNYLINQKREHIAQIEGRYGMAVRIEGDPAIVSPDFAMEKFRTATRVVEIVAPVVSIDTTPMDELEEDEIEIDEDLDEAPEAEAPEAARPQPTQPGQPERAGDDGGGKRKRRRRRRRRGGGNGDENGSRDDEDAIAADGDTSADTGSGAAQESVTDARGESVPQAEAPSDGEGAAAPRTVQRTSSRRGGRRGKAPAHNQTTENAEVGADTDAAASAETPTPDAPAADASTDAPAVTETPVTGEAPVASDATKAAEAAPEAPVGTDAPVQESVADTETATVQAPEAEAAAAADSVAPPAGVVAEVAVPDVAAEPAAPETAAAEPAEQQPAPQPAAQPEPALAATAVPAKSADVVAELPPVADAPAENVTEQAEEQGAAAEPEPEEAEPQPARPRRTGWWSKDA